MKSGLLLWLFVAISAIHAFAQTRTITGKVTDARDGAPVPFATIKIQGTNRGTTTDKDGNFTVQVDERQTLEISFVGYETKLVQVGNSSTINVSLAVGENVLTEYIATGYTNTNRRKMVSAVAEVGANQLANTPFVDVNQALQGKAAGVFVGGASGQPGAVQQVRVRGIGSISSGAAPLYVIDGIIVDGRDINKTSDLQLQSNDLLANLNPNDIESVNVLKDAAATALYGSRGANGVIVINTKKGKAGSTIFNMRAQYGILEPSFGKWEMMTPAESLKYNRDVLALNGATPAEIDAEYPMSLLDNAFNWRKAGYRTAATQDYGISASGGNDKTKFYISTSYTDQEGTVIHSDLKRFSVLSNISHKVNDRLDMGLNLNLSYTNTSSSADGARYGSPLLGGFFISPFQSPYKADGTLYTGLESDFVSGSGDNFLYSTALNSNKLNNFRGLGAVNIGYRIFDWLKISEKANIDLVYGTTDLFYDPTTADGYNSADPLKSGSVYNANIRNVTFTNQLSASGTVDINSDNQLDYTAVMEYSRFRSNYFSAEGIGLVTGKLKVLDVTSTPQDVGGSGTEYSFLSYLGQVNYTFKNKYNFNASIRTDGSSRFGANNRYGTFYSLGASWRIIDEPFMKTQKVFSDLRLRGSYGVTGNADFDNFVAQALYSYSTSYNGVPGNAPNTIGNDILTWEKNKAANIGLELGFIDNRITATIDLYRRVTDGLLMNTPVSSTTGFTTQQVNVGSVLNRGIEALISSKNIQSPNGFSWSTDLNFSMNRNKILSLYKDQDITGSISIQRVGEHVGSWYMARWAGVDESNGDPLWYTADGKTTNNLNLAERRVVGNSEPRFIGGLTNTFSYKGVGLSVFLYGVTGNKTLNQTRVLGDADGAYFGLNYNKQAGENYWQAAGDKAERPKPIPGGNRNANSAQSTRFLEDGSFLRLKNVTLSYNLPKRWVQSIKVSDIKFYAQAANILTWTKYTGWDPEQDMAANEFFRYPPAKSVTFGVNVNF